MTGRAVFFALAAMGALTFIGPLRAGPGPGDDIDITVIEELSFGMVSAPTDGPGFVDIDPATGNRRASVGISEIGGFYGPAVFLVKGQPLRLVHVTVPRQITGQGSSGPVRITNIAIDVANPVRLNERGEAIIRVGGRVELAPNQGIDRVRAAYTLTVDYVSE